MERERLGPTGDGQPTVADVAEALEISPHEVKQFLLEIRQQEQPAAVPPTSILPAVLPSTPVTGEDLLGLGGVVAGVYGLISILSGILLLLVFLTILMLKKAAVGMLLLAAIVLVVWLLAHRAERVDG